MSSLEEFAAERLRALERRRLRRRLAVTERQAGAGARRDDATLVSFACNDYLGFSHHPDVIEASAAATRRYGTGAGAARLITGNHPLYDELERKLAAWKGTEDCVVFGSGYLTNVGVVPALVGAADLVLVDELAHSCLLTGAALSRARVLHFRHNDAAHAAELLGRHRDRHRHCLILTEGVFSMDGDVAPLPALAELAATHDAWLMVDDAHALGVLGGGRGTAFAWSPPVRVPLQMGTLSKALGAYGGYLCASRAVAELVRNRARSFVYSTGLPPGVVAAAGKALDLLAADPARAAVPLARARAFTAALGLPAAASAVVPLVLGSTERALAASAALQQAGFLVPAIRPPTVPPGTARLRVAFSAEHSETDVRRLAAAIAPLLEPAP
ncbi:MAG TPA: 8-amino-7-oxononanoate synthase [Gammaproteobacteria bacterium]